MCMGVRTYLSLPSLFHFLPDTGIENQSKNRRLHICWDRKNESAILFAWMRLEKHIAEVGLIRPMVKSHPASIGSVSDDHFSDVKWNGATVFNKGQAQGLLD